MRVDEQQRVAVEQNSWTTRYTEGEGVGEQRGDAAAAQKRWTVGAWRVFEQPRSEATKQRSKVFVRQQSEAGAEVPTEADLFERVSIGQTEQRSICGQQECKVCGCVQIVEGVTQHGA